MIEASPKNLPMSSEELEMNPLFCNWNARQLLAESGGGWNSSKRKPSEEEAILATKEMDALYEKIKSELGNEVQVVTRIGSSFWGRNYSIRGKEHGDPSDLDLEIVADQIPPSLLERVSPNERKAFKEFEELFKAGKADLCSIKLKIDGIEVSFHIAPTKTFKKICGIDYENIDSSIYLREYRVTDELKPKEYIHRNFAGDIYNHTTTPCMHNHGQVSDIPLVTIGNHGEFVFGIILNKYLPIPPELLENRNIRKHINHLVKSLQKRRVLDQKKMPERELSFTKFHSHVEQMPDWVIKELKMLD